MEILGGQHITEGTAPWRPYLAAPVPVGVRVRLSRLALPLAGNWRGQDAKSWLIC